MRLMRARAVLIGVAASLLLSLPVGCRSDDSLPHTTVRPLALATQAPGETPPPFPDTDIVTTDAANLEVFIFEWPVVFKDAAPLLVGDTPYLPLAAMIEAMRGEYNWDPNTHECIGNTANNQSFLVNLGENWFMMPNREKKQLDNQVIQHNGTAYVSIEFLRVYLNTPITWLKADNKMYLYPEACAPDQNDCGTDTVC